MPPAVSKTAKPPKFALDGKKWAVEHQVGNRTLVIEDVNPKQTVYVYDCVDCVIQIKGKANNITLDKCAKTGVVFEDVLATCELVNCVSMQVQCTGLPDGGHRQGGRVPGVSGAQIVRRGDHDGEVLRGQRRLRPGGGERRRRG